MNALGFVNRPLYLFPEFMGTKPVEILIRGGLKAEYSGRFLHNDTTSMSLQGEYEREEGDLEPCQFR